MAAIPVGLRPVGGAKPGGGRYVRRLPMPFRCLPAKPEIGTRGGEPFGFRGFSRPDGTAGGARRKTRR
jgi:hypothetical protein